MNDYIGNLLANELITIPFVTKAAGCITVLSKQVGETIKKFPCSKTIYRKNENNTVICERKEAYFDLLPNSNEAAVLYFEDLTCKLESTNKRYDVWRSQIKLVCWLHLDKVGFETDVLSNYTLNSIPKKLKENDNFLGGTAKVVEIYPKRPSPFETYDHNETNAQFLTHPFDAFALKIETVSYVKNNCLPIFELNPILC